MVMYASRTGRVSVLAVVVALFFCHRAYGYAHRLPPAEASMPRTPCARRAATILRRIRMPTGRI